MHTPHERGRDVFGRRAAFYATSDSHTDRRVPARVVDLAEARPGWRVLDVATGAGHTAFALAPHVRSVVAVDLTAGMLAEARTAFDLREVGGELHLNHWYAMVCADRR